MNNENQAGGVVTHSEMEKSIDKALAPVRQDIAVLSAKVGAIEEGQKDLKEGLNCLAGKVDKMMYALVVILGGSLLTAMWM